MGCKSSRGAESSELSTAIRSGSVAKLRRLLDSGVDVNSPDAASGEVPLVLAAQASASTEVVSVLLDARANPSCASCSGTPLPFLFFQSDPSNRLIQFFLERGILDHDAISPEGDKDTLLLAALKACRQTLAVDLIEHGAPLDARDAADNTPLHVAGAIADEMTVRAILEKGGDVTRSHLRSKNSDGHTPILCARLAAVAPDRRLSPAQHWCSREQLKKPEIDQVENVLLEKGEEVWRCPSTAWCCCLYSYYSPSFPKSHEIAATLALASGDSFSLTDAVEGAWIDGQAPPIKAAGEVNPTIMKAIHSLVQVLQRELRAGLESKDKSRLASGLEMLHYARVAKMPEEERAVRMLVRVELEQAVASNSELELKQALMSAAQYGHTSTPLFKQAQDALELILEERRFECILEQIREATRREDLFTLHALLESGKSRKPRKSITDHQEYQEAESFLVKRATEGLTKAVSSCNKKAVRTAMRHIEQFGLQQLPEYQRLLRLQRDTCIQSLKEVALVRQVDLLRQALQAALEDPDLRSCSLKDDPEFKNVLQVYRELLELPSYFDDEQLLNKVTLRSSTKRKQVESELLQDAFQMLFDMTHSRVRTKDRRGAVPKRLVVKEVDVVQNADNLIQYMRRRDQISKDFMMNPQKFKGILNNRSTLDTCQTLCSLPNGKQFHTVWRETNSFPNDPIDSELNEFYLFHGTGPEAALKIAEGDFRLDLSGTNAGTLYGRGIYFAESSAKSDEYAQQDARGLNPMLICRVTLGRYWYTSEEYPDTGALVRHCTRGEHHSVLGDRRKCRGTFREMIIYDKDQAYPEFIVWYAREF